MRSLMRFAQRKSRLAGLAAVALTLAAGCGSQSASPSGQSSQPVTLTFVGSGGVLQDIEVKAYFTPYEKLHPNVTILQDSPINYAKLQAMVEAGNVSWDLAEGGPQFGLAPAQTALLEKVDCNVVPCSHLQPDKYITTGYRIAENISATAITYRTDKFSAGNEPKTWADFYDTKKFPGKRTMVKLPGSVGSNGILESALLGDGVSPASLYPLDVPRALKKLDTIRANLILAADNQACTTNLATGEAVMGICFNGRAYTAHLTGAPVAIQWNASFLSPGYLFIPKGGKHVKEAMQLAAYLVSDDHAAAITPYIPYGPANAIAKSDPVTADWNPVTHPGVGVVINAQWWADNSVSAIQQWTAWQLNG